MTEATPAAKAAFIDINNISLSDEIMEGFDPSANQFAAPPAVEPGLYTVTLFFAEEDITRRWFPLAYNPEKYPSKVGKSYEKTRLIGRITQPGNDFDGRVVKDTFVSTGIFGSQTTSKVASLVHLFGRGDELYAGMTAKELRDLFESALAGEPMVRAKVDWEWQGSKEGGYVTVRGQENFPTDDKGNFVCSMEDPAVGRVISGYAAIVKYLPL